MIAFDENAAWVVPITDLTNPNAVVSAVESIRSGGGTDIYAGLLAMSQVLPEVPSVVKHAILLTDGGADPTGIPQLVEEMYAQYGITLTTVGIGTDAAPYLADLAELGGGRYHFAADPGSIPSIFTEETTLAMRSYIVEETFYPVQTARSPIISGIAEIPPLHGYIGTTAKQTAQTILSSPGGDPLLAAWQYGLGRAVAFTSDATGRWAKDWITWQGFPIFWSQAVNYTLRDRTDTGLEIRVNQQGEKAQILLNAQTQSGAYINDYGFKVSLVGPDRGVHEINLNQVAPGQYAGEFQPETSGVYLITVRGEPNSGVEGGFLSVTTGWSMTYSPEYRLLEPNPGYLSDLVDRAGGRILDDPKEAFDHTLPSPAASQPIWPWLVTVAALLLPFDVAVRRLVISWEDVRRWSKNIRRRLQLTPTPAPASTARSEQIEALFQAKQRVRPEDEPPTPSPGLNEYNLSGVTKPIEKETEVQISHSKTTGKLHPVKGEAQTSQDERERSPEERRDKSTAAILLSLKKRRQDDED